MRSFFLKFLKLPIYKNASFYALIALLLFILIVRLVSLNFYPLMSTTEARYAEMSRKILELNEWIVLYYYDYQTPFWGKPPLSFWASAVSMWIFGVNEFGARFAPFIFGLLCCGMFFLWQFRCESSENVTLRPIACAIILSSTGLGFVASGAVMTDEALLFCVMLCMISFWRCVISNLSLDKHSADFANFGRSQTASLVSSLKTKFPRKFAKSNESHTENPSVVDSVSAESSNNQSCDSTQNSPNSWCEKSDSRLQSRATADFSLESEKRGIPPKSEKAAAFWHVGGAGRGVQPFCKKEKSNSNKQSGDNIANSKSHQIFGYLFFVGLGLGLLAKGPLILVLVGLPIVAFLITLKILTPHAKLHLKNLPFFSGSVLMLLIALPWYITFEVKSSGFLEYFIIGEHFKRFFVSGWEGSLYGEAHSQPIGMIWWFFFISFLPWSVVFLGFIIKKIFFRKNFMIKITLNPIIVENLYLSLWIIMPLCFLTFSRNILEAYTLPCAPAFCIICANFIFGTQVRFRRLIWLLPFVLMLIVCVFLTSGKLDSLVDSRHQKDIFTRWDGEGRLIFLDTKPSFSGYFYAHQVAKKPFRDEFLSLKSPNIESILKSNEKIVIAMEESDFWKNKERFRGFSPIIVKKEWILLTNHPHYLSVAADK